MGEAGGFTSTFIVKRMVIHSGGDAREEVPTTPATEPSTPGVVLSTPGGVPSNAEGVPSTSAAAPSAPVVEPTTLGVVPTAPAVDPTTPAVVPSGLVAMLTTPAVVPSGPAAMPTTPVEQGSQGLPIKFTSPPSDINEFVDAFHDGEEVRFHRLDNIVGNAGATGLASRLLDDPELLLVNAKEPPTFAVAERDANWRRRCWKR